MNRIRLRTPGIGARRQRGNLTSNQRISFEDYLNTWKGIATSKASFNEENPLLSHLSLQPKLQAQHLALHADELGIDQIVILSMNIKCYFVFVSSTTT